MVRGFRSFVILLVVLFSMSTAHAAPWGQWFEETGVGIFDELALFMVEGSETFTGLGSYSVTGWTDLETPTYISAQGQDTTYLLMYLGFTGKTPFTFDFFAFDNTSESRVLRDAATVRWTQNYTWDIRALSIPEGQIRYVNDLVATNPVPEPATMLLFGTGIAGFAAVRRRK